MTVVAEALARTAKERDQVVADAQGALDKAADLELELALLQDQNDQIFRQLEEAMAISMEPLDKMFRAAGMPTDRIIDLDAVIRPELPQHVSIGMLVALAGVGTKDAHTRGATRAGTSGDEFPDAP